jgi:hypothetical protein
MRRDGGRRVRYRTRGRGRRRGGLRALPLRLLALGSLGVVVAAAAALFREWEYSARDGGRRWPPLPAALPTESAPQSAEDSPGVLDRAVDSVAFPDCQALRLAGGRREDR